MAHPDLEPVTPDPKKLRLTAFALVIVMVVGGILILKAYEKSAKESAKDDRPAVITRISKEKDLVFMRQDGVISDLLALEGNVIVIQTLAHSQPDPTSTAVMTRLAERYAERDDLFLVTLAIDPGPPEELAGFLEKAAENLGAKLPQWVVASNDRPTLHKFIKNEFKANLLPYERDGKWNYDPSLVLIDRQRHVRRAVIPQKRGGASFVATFDFDQAVAWDSQGIKTGTDLSNVEQLETLLHQTIETVLEQDFKP